VAFPLHLTLGVSASGCAEPRYWVLPAALCWQGVPVRGGQPGLQQ